MIDLETQIELPSALSPESTVAESPRDPRGAPVRSRFGFRPLLAYGFGQEARSVWMGGQVSHTVFAAQPRVVQPVWENRLTLEAPLATAGLHAGFRPRGGLFLGPASLWLGGRVSWEALDWGPAELNGALLVGPTVGLGLDVQGWVVGSELESGFRLAGERASLSGLPGEDLSWRTTLQVPLGVLVLLPGYQHSWTPIGSLHRVNLGFHVQLL